LGRRSTITLVDMSLACGGFRRDTINLALGFSRIGLEVDVILARKDGEEFYRELPSSVRVIDLRLGRAAQLFFPLLKYLKRRPTQVLISTSTETNLFAILARTVARVPTRVVVREAIVWPDQVEPHIRGRGAVLLAKRMYRLADSIVAVSKGIRHGLARELGIREDLISVIYNPTLTPGLVYRAEELPDHLWFQPGMPPVILGVGRLHPQKDFPLLLRAFQIVRRGRNCRLVILGEGQERSKLETIARELGVQEDTDLPGFAVNPFGCMARAGVFVLSSAMEAFGHVLVEAMACGCPVVSTNCPGGPSEILEEGRLGPLVPVGDPVMLAHAIERVLDNPTPPQVLREGAMRFSAESIARDYLKLPAFEGIV
jgi:glycosyltransferase involved in cell wall biosynthesis